MPLGDHRMPERIGGYLISAGAPCAAAVVMSMAGAGFGATAGTVLCAAVLGPVAAAVLEHRRTRFRRTALETLSAELPEELPPDAPEEQILRQAVLVLRQHKELERRCEELDRVRLLERFLGNNGCTMVFSGAEEHISRLAKDGLLQMPYPLFCLAYLHMADYAHIFFKPADDLTVEDVTRVQKTVQKVFSDCVGGRVRCCCVEYQSDCACLLNLPKDEEWGDDDAVISRVKSWCGTALKQLEEQYGLVAAAAVSSPFPSITGTHDALEECLGLLRYGDMLGLDGPTFTPLDVPGENRETELRRSALGKKYLHAMITLDLQQAESLLLEILSPEFFTTVHHTDTAAQMVLLHLGTAFDMMGRTMEKEPELMRLCREIDEAQNLDELRGLVQQVFEQFNMPRVPEGRLEARIRQLQDYIDQHFADPDLGLPVLGEAFSMNPSYIARVFKQKTGKSVMEYVHQRRVQDVKELLENTPLTLTEIALRCGYTSGWTLTRAFKRCEGITPGAYREARAGRDAPE